MNTYRAVRDPFTQPNVWHKLSRAQRWMFAGRRCWLIETRCGRSFSAQTGDLKLRAPNRTRCKECFR